MTTSLKFVIVGDGNVGKTCLLLTLTTNAFPSPLPSVLCPAGSINEVRSSNSLDEYIPSVFDDWKGNVKLQNGRTVAVTMVDTGSRIDDDKFRLEAYPGADLVLICCSVVNPSSFEVNSRWAPEVFHKCPDVPFLLCGTKIDLREDPDTMEKFTSKNIVPISEEQGAKIAKEAGAAGYVECSALTQSGLRRVLEEAARIAMKPRHGQGQKKAAPCALM